MQPFVRFAIRLGMILLLLPPVLGYSSTGFHEPSPTGGDITVATTSPYRGCTRLEFTNPRISREEVAIGDEHFTDLWIEGESQTLDSGLPSLPVVNRVIGIPDRGKVQLRILAAEYTEQNENKLYPSQGIDADPDVPSPLLWNRDFYNQDKWYPEEIVKLGEPAVMRDVRLVTVSVCPVQYNPATGVIRTYHNIEVQIEPTPGPGVNEKTRSFPHPSKLFMPMYRQLENFEYLGLDQEELQLPGTYLIICGDNTTILQEVQIFVNWKLQQGIPTVVRTDWSNANGIKNIILNLYNTSDPPLEYVLLVGSPVATGAYNVPTFQIPNLPGHATDHTFTMLVGNDILGDVAIGRWPVSSTNELRVVRSKTINYEKDPYMSQNEWFSSSTLLAGIGIYRPGGMISNRYTMRYIEQQMAEQGFSNINYAEYPPAFSVAHWINEQIDTGRSFFFWRPISNGEAYSLYPVTAIDDLNNHCQLPFVSEITCYTCVFNGSPSDICVHWLLAGSVLNPRGAVASVGMTSGTYVYSNNIITAGMAYSFFVNNSPEPGIAVMEAKFQCFRICGDRYPIPGQDQQIYRLTLMGDPGIKIWNATPQLFDVEHPTSIPLGRNNIPILVKDAQGNPVADALVCLMKGTETWTRVLTDESGYLHMPTDPLTVGIDSLTVSKTGFKPYRAYISVDVQTLYLGYEQTVLIDDDNQGGTSGNGDGVLNPGETVDLQIRIHNYGSSTTATVVKANLWSYNKTLATVLSGDLSYPNAIAPGQSATFAGSFRVEISRCAQDQVLTPLLLRIKCQQNAVGDTSIVPLTIVSGRAQFEFIQFPGGNNYPWAGTELVVSIKNVGSREFIGTQGKLITSDPRIRIIDNYGWFGDIGVDQLANNDGDRFVLECNPLETFPGHPVAFILALKGNAQPQFRDTVTFVAQVGSPTLQDPTGPDTYGYYCYDNSEEEPRYDVKVQYGQYNWVEIDPGFGGPGNHLDLEDFDEDLDESIAAPLPFDFRMYGVDYEAGANGITICSNGWAALGDQTQFADFRNYRIPGPLGPNAMLAALWDDLVVGVNVNPPYNYGHVCWYFNEEERYLVIEWSRVRNRLDTVPVQTFEIILYDPSIWHTRTGDGMIKFQYLTVTNIMGNQLDNGYATVGIENHTQTDGLEVTYHEGLPDGYAPGAAHLQNGRSYLFTNLENLAYGGICGTVTTYPSQAPIPGATVAIPQAFYETQTNDQGQYVILDVLTGPYTVTCTAPGYSLGYRPGVKISEGALVTENFALRPTRGSLDSLANIRFLKPYEYSLGQSYPNPFNPITTIPYCLREAGAVKLALYNVLGQKVATLVDEYQEAGAHRAMFDATSLASGIYFYRLEASSFVEIRKMVLLR